MKQPTLPRTLLALLVAALTASAGCIGALKDDEPEPASTDDDVDAGAGATPTVVNEPPVAKLRVTNDQDTANETRRGFKGDVLKLSGANSTDADGRIVNWTWTLVEPLGELSPKTSTHYGEVVSGIQFNHEGVKVITLTVTDNLGAASSTSVTYYRDVSYSFGGEFRWTTVTEPVTETEEHTFPVFAGAAVVGASIQIDGAQAEIALIDPDGNEHVKGATETDNVTILMDHGAPVSGNWTVRVTVTYEPATAVCEDVPGAGTQCTPAAPVATAHEADYGLQGLVWYGEAPEVEKAGGDGHDHEH